MGAVMSTNPLFTAHNLKPLNSMARLVSYADLGDVDAALRVHRHSVAMRKFTGLVTRAAESRQDLPTGVIEDIHLFVLFI